MYCFERMAVLLLKRIEDGSNVVVHSGVCLGLVETEAILAPAVAISAKQIAASHSVTASP
jgi:urocanate hydratase